VAAVCSTADAVFQPARRTQFAHQMAAGCIDILTMFRFSEVRAGPCFDACRELAMTVFKEWPR
jgi:hypothetical protein